MTTRAAVDHGRVVDVPHSPPDPNPKDRLPSRFRLGRWFLLAEGVLVAELAGAAMAAHGVSSVRGSAGFTLWGLTLTPPRSGALFAFGVVAVVATLNRRATMIVATAALVSSVALTGLGEVALAAGVPHQWGVDPHNAALYAGLVVYNFAVVTWLFPDLRERHDRPERRYRAAESPHLAMTAEQPNERHVAVVRFVPRS